MQQRDHQESKDGSCGVDDKLPSFSETYDSPAEQPSHNNNYGENKPEWRANYSIHKIRESLEFLLNPSFFSWVFSFLVHYNNGNSNK